MQIYLCICTHTHTHMGTVLGLGFIGRCFGNNVKIFDKEIVLSDLMHALQSIMSLLCLILYPIRNGIIHSGSLRTATIQGIDFGSVQTVRHQLHFHIVATDLVFNMTSGQARDVYNSGGINSGHFTWSNIVLCILT